MTYPVRSRRDDREKTLSTEELFFSTTDRRGVIRQGNSVFVRISGYSLAELVGAPHNIVRHPDMPGGAFRLVWDRLTAGRPVGAYVKNQAKDGMAYWVFAVLSPLHDGYISVRMPPRARLFDQVKKVYAQAYEAELEAAREKGLSRRDAALVGMADIEASLRRHGFASYDEFMLEALPAEVSARSHLVSTTYARPGAFGPIAEVLVGAEAVDGLLGDLVGRLSAYQNLSDKLTTASSKVLDIAHRLERSVTAAQHASELAADSAPVLVNVARVMAAPMHKAVTALEQLRPELGRLRGDVAELRFRISLASLYNDMVAAFAAEVVDGTAPSDSLRAVPLLCDASESGLIDMSTQVRRVNDELHAVADLVAEAQVLLEDFRRFLGQWRILVLRHKSGPLIGDRLDPIDNEISASWNWMEVLRELGQEYQSAVVSFDTDLLQAYLTKIRMAMVAI